MKKYKVHIASILTCILIFPFLYQNVHIVQHQLKLSAEEQSCCHIPSSNEGISFSTDNEGQGDCPICTYEMSVRPLIEIGAYQFLPMQVFRRVICPLTTSYAFLAESHYGARAPPRV